MNDFPTAQPYLHALKNITLSECLTNYGKKNQIDISLTVTSVAYFSQCMLKLDINYNFLTIDSVSLFLAYFILVKG